jgi:hypothetical protein
MNRCSKAALVITGSLAAFGMQLARASDSQILDACIQQFIASDLSGYEGKISVHKEPVPYQSLATRSPHGEDVMLSAASVHGEQLVSAVCHVDRSGNVVSLVSTPTAAKLSALKKPVAIADNEK